MHFYRSLLTLSFFIAYANVQCQLQPDAKLTNESLYRPVFHFTPKHGWMNDPNGMIYLNGQYHLFFQHYPDSTVWGPMHWGHATSIDLVQWKEQAIALYPDSIGMIFSGSAVLDKNNTSGLGRGGIAPLVAIFTQHYMPGEKAARTDFQNQSIAYSLDEGKTWTKYAGNPVLKTPNIKDFRDPKVIWHAPTQKWIMNLAVADHVEFYSSPNLINWIKESEIGKNLFAHGGVWECPDLLHFNLNGKTIWVLLVSMNPGGPNGGSATQYIVGDFDGHIFKPYSTDIKWMDYGPDNYAGVTFSNIGDRNILIGWMSNWNYANVVPTEKWRSAMTVPRELSLIEQNNNKKENSKNLLLVSSPVKEFMNAFTEIISKENVIPNRIDFKDIKAVDFEITLSNISNEKLILGYHADKEQFYIDRTKAGISNFKEGFASVAVALRLSNTTKIDLSILLDKTSIELFADGGRTVMTALFFPTSPYTKWEIKSKEKRAPESIKLYSFK
ncbi:MAG: glycoside hydrolase family 32 protein [Sediminibacterium sp.]